MTKTDVGSPSEQPDGGDRLKAAFSDALKRAAVKFGIGRYLYRLKSEWVDYDPQKKQLLQKPELPVWGKPGPSKSAGERIAARLA
ncbi:Rad52/Rad22 family DNA repair protein, partial [Loigolactobacillus coryniformis]|uniref:Rad52/Rad22 family DNA repair protein n=1 Tax=Loigolactobacillus coryniformis TaxID=1610 RepID=UPI00201AB806